MCKTGRFEANPTEYARASHVFEKLGLNVTGTTLRNRMAYILELCI